MLDKEVHYNLYILEELSQYAKNESNAKIILEKMDLCVIVPQMLHYRNDQKVYLGYF